MMANQNRILINPERVHRMQQPYRLHRSLPIESLPRIQWEDIIVDEDIGRGAFGICKLVHTKEDPYTRLVMKTMAQVPGRLDTKLFELEKKFEKEIKILSILNHDNVVKMKAYTANPTSVLLEYIFFEFQYYRTKLKVNNLQQLLGAFHRCNIVQEIGEKRKTFSEIARGVINGLHYLHMNDIVHRDLKPANILVANHSSHEIVCKLTDFGESRGELIQTNNILHQYTDNLLRGTVPFMAPEQMTGTGSHASLGDLKAMDMWSLGLTLFCVVNPDLTYPYEIEALKNSGTNIQMTIFNCHMKKILPSESPRYETLRTLPDFDYLCVFYKKCLVFEPKLRPHFNSDIDTQLQRGRMIKLDTLLVTKKERKESIPITREIIDYEKSCRPVCSERITNPRQLEAGDHIRWRHIAAWRHGIIIKVTPRGNIASTTIIRYSLVCGAGTEVRQEEWNINLQGDLVYTLDYGEHTHSPQVVITRAKACLGHSGYNALRNDNEDFSRWCKSGKHTYRCTNETELCSDIFDTTDEEGGTHCVVVNNMDTIKRGDHIRWRPRYNSIAGWRHGIVLTVNQNQTEVISSENNNSIKAMSLDLAGHIIHHYVYDRCHLPDDVINRASSRIGASVSPVNHLLFAQWCKLGSPSDSYSVHRPVVRGTAAGAAAAAAAVAGVVVTYRSFCRKDITKDELHAQNILSTVRLTGGAAAGVGGGAAGAAIGTLIFPAIGAIVGGIIGGIVGGVAGTTGGHFAGKGIAQAARRPYENLFVDDGVEILDEEINN